MIFTTTQQASELDPDFCSTPHVPPSCNKAAPWWGWSDRYCRKGEVWIAPLPYAPCFSGQNVAKSFAEHCGLLRVNERFLRPCQFSTANACLRNRLGHPSHPNPHPKKKAPRSAVQPWDFGTRAGRTRRRYQQTSSDEGLLPLAAEWPVLIFCVACAFQEM